MQRACARVPYIPSVRPIPTTPNTIPRTRRIPCTVPSAGTLLSTRAFLIRGYAAICDPPPFVFASVIILLSSMSKLMVVKKGIHLTLTNKLLSPKPTLHFIHTNFTSPCKILYIPRVKPFTSPRRRGILRASGIQQQPARLPSVQTHKNGYMQRGGEQL